MTVIIKDGWMMDLCECVPVCVMETHCLSVLLLRVPSTICALTQYTPPACRGMYSSVCSGSSGSVFCWKGIMGNDERTIDNR